MSVMAVMKCKMCGGDLNVTEGVSVVECEYCGSRQTIPNQDSEKKLTLFARADRLRRANEFDKAAGIYESIVADFPTEAEAYWGLVLCRYGIEYVNDPATGKRYQLVTAPPLTASWKMPTLTKLARMPTLSPGGCIGMKPKPSKTSGKEFWKCLAERNPTTFSSVTRRQTRMGTALSTALSPRTCTTP